MRKRNNVYDVRLVLSVELGRLSVSVGSFRLRRHYRYTYSVGENLDTGRRTLQQVSAVA